ncbi:MULTISPECIES: helix-turn-helix domain-containing protein [Pseudofrankia]|uniref:helix-turn-helix domain-containing protein n=1 Tax=Pseudofrankia TaxID=2994363 RepID=UPI000234B1B3|nr:MULTISPECIES: MarR family transcriptional regulator [Pseudofrankia]OHV32811.1 MarR family transcriptional regulator [Pseudofrankia sp. EUN1h]
MDGFELFLLGRRLMKLGEQSIPEVGVLRLSGPTRAVVFDVFENPGSSISEITARVQFPQSQVSACVARLREAGVVETISDPEDRRRTLVQPTADARERARHRPAAEIDQAIVTAIGTSDHSEVQRVKDALEAVANLLRRDDHDGASNGRAEP